jgi:DNA primase
MARIRDEDIQAVRERARIDEVVEQYVTLRRGKGLCPFHDEKSPSFTVRPSTGFYHCFGCNAGGDSINFLMEIEGLPFADAVERLASRYGIQLRYEDGGPTGPKRDPQLRNRILEAHKLAGAFYAEFLNSSAEAEVGRGFLKDRGFTADHAEQFGVGFAPRSGEALKTHLMGKGFNEDELVTGGLARRGGGRLWDAFQGRLLWPIREMTGETIGFGARRLFDDDRMEAKYLNTVETPIYKKSHVLYGIDLARRQMSGAGQAVVVEGYTDVMACHVAGVNTAVATCGTAFGEGHARILRRVMADHNAFRGEVIFTFDGDEAGQRAALKAFEGDQQFVAQTYVSVEPRGMDPCELRVVDGDEAVRELVASRIPLYRFVLGNTLRSFDLDRADQRVDAVREAVGLASAIRDVSKVDAFLREIATRTGVEVDEVRAAHRSQFGNNRVARPAALADQPTAASLGAPEFSDEREALKAMVQYPHLAAPHVGDLHDNDFTHPVARRLWQGLSGAQWPDREDPGWLPQVADRLDEDLRPFLQIAAVDQLHIAAPSAAAFVTSALLRLRVLTLSRRIGELKSRLQRTNPLDDAPRYNQLFGELVALEQEHRDLRERAATGGVADFHN